MKINSISSVSYSKILNSKNAAKVTNPIRKTVANNTAPLMSVAAATAITSAAMVKQPITSIEISDKMLKSGFVVDSKGEYKKPISAEEEVKLYEEMSFFSKNYKKMYERSLEHKQIDLMKDFLKVDREKGEEIFDKHFDNTLLTFLILGYNGRLVPFIEKCKEDKNYFQMIENIAKSDVKGNIYSFAEYKMDSDSDINTELRRKYINKEYAIHEHNKINIDKISNYMETQNIEKPIKLYRGEGFEILDKVKLGSGEEYNLGEKMYAAQKSRNKEEINKIKEFVLDNEITAFQPAFMSTTISQDKSSNFGSREGFVWEITTEPNTKGVFVEGLNIGNFFPNEDEVLLQKGTTLKINGISFDYDANKWCVSATASN